MCGRFALYALHAELAQILRLVDFPADYEPRYNIAPTQAAPVVRAVDSTDRRADLWRWGLIPFWAEDPAIGNRMINARSETIADKPAFRAAFKSRRCIVPASGFYEWRKLKDVRQPYYIHDVNNQPLLLAGLWDHWLDKQTGEQIDSFTIITTSANKTLKPLHDRMPVILTTKDTDAWLNTDNDSPRRLLSLLSPAAQERLQFEPVSTHVNSPRHDDPRCIEPINLTDSEPPSDLFNL